LDTPSLSAVRLVVDLTRDSVTFGVARGFSAGLLVLILARGWVTAGALAGRRHRRRFYQCDMGFDSFTAFGLGIIFGSQ